MDPLGIPQESAGGGRESSTPSASEPSPRCEKCNGALYSLEHDPDADEYYPNGDSIISIDGHELYCMQCKLYYMKCSHCSQDGHIELCKFLGFQGIFIPEDQLGKKDFDIEGEEWIYAPNCPGTHPKWFKELKWYGDAYSIVTCLNDEHLGAFPEEIYDHPDYPRGDVIPYYVGYMNLRYFPPVLNGKHVWHTGPDGNYEHYWKCLKCSDIEIYCNH